VNDSAFALVRVVVRGGVEPPTFRFSGVLSCPFAVLIDQDASPAHRHKAWSNLLEPILAVVPKSAAVCRFVRGDLVVIFIGARTCGASVGSIAGHASGVATIDARGVVAMPWG
jgi:hypothetical protein